MSKPTSNRQIGRNIRTAREAKDLSQVELGVKLGHKKTESNSFISLLEAGKWMPKLNTLQRIARVLGTSLEALLAK